MSLYFYKLNWKYFIKINNSSHGDVIMFKIFHSIIKQKASSDKAETVKC